MNILIVDDEKLTLTALKLSIESLGHTCYLADSGEKALEQIVGHEIDMVFSDILMNGISGLSLVSILRNIYLYQRPIILISNLESEMIRNTYFNLGANDFISKPFSIAEIATSISMYANRN